MYRQILVDPRDRKYQRILWRHSPDDTIKEYELNTVTYGTTSAPYLAIWVLRQLADDEGNNFPQATEILQSSTYVDDCIFGADSVQDAIERRDQLVKLLTKGGFPLAKWSANDESLFRDIGALVGRATDKEFTVTEKMHVLGIGWNPMIDYFYYKVSLSLINRPTKRSILSEISKLYDPSGWICPVIITAKIFIQRLWLLKCDWDDSLPADLLAEWTTFHDQLPVLQQVRVPRWTGVGVTADSLQLDGFCDASSKAYAAAVYLKLEVSDSVHSSLLIAKSKVAPVKPVTIPRLELCAAVLLARLMKFVLDSLSNLQLSYWCWSDSTVVLEWVKNPPAKWKTFVAHRVDEVQTLLPTARWQHVRTSDNPADLGSRGLTPKEFLSCPIWWSGPAWLSKPSNSWPISHPMSPPPSDALEENCKLTVCHQRMLEPWLLASRFSSWFKLLRVTAYVYRFLRLSARTLPTRPSTLGLSASEITLAKKFWLKYIQQEAFPKELDEIRIGSLSASNSLLPLNSFIDADGLIRVRGWLRHAQIPAREKYPIILKSHPLLTLLMRDVHKLLCHCGPSLLLSVLRTEFWIIRSRQLARFTLYACVVCARHRGHITPQFMGDLPRFQVTPTARAFMHTGLDYAGPMQVRTSSGRGHKSTKAFIAVFVCMVTKAVHLEVVPNYSTPAFLAALHRFISRLGSPSDIYSDNGTNFVGANRELVADLHTVQDVELQNHCASSGITWHFTPPSAPHFGGLWEVSIRGIKRYLARSIGSYTLIHEELSTVLCRIEACVNSRPLVALSDSLDDYSTLTPGHFLISGPLVPIPEPSVLDLNEHRLSRWQLLQRLTETFWAAWRREYLHTLQQRSKWHKRSTDFFPDRMVLIKVDGLPPTRWALGRIIECLPGSDNLVRVVVLKTSTSVLKRPITKVCLPVDINREEENPRAVPST